MLRSYKSENLEPQSPVRAALKLLLWSSITGAIAIFASERLFASGTVGTSIDLSGNTLKSEVHKKAINEDANFPNNVQKNAHQSQSNNFNHCVKENLYGRTDGACASNRSSPVCAGYLANLAKYKQKKSKCSGLKKLVGLCKSKAKKFKNQFADPFRDAIGDIGSGKRTKNGTCTDIYNPNARTEWNAFCPLDDQENCAGATGVAASIVDSMVQGSGVSMGDDDIFGLDPNDYAKQFLAGKSEADILANSPFGKSLTPGELAEWQKDLTEPDDGSLADLDDDDLNDGEYGSGANNVATKAGSEGDFLGGLLGKDPSAENGKDDPFGKLASKDGTDKDGRDLASDGANKRKSPFDRTIFDMVSSQYRKNEPNLVDISVFMRKAAREKRARDVKDSARTPTAAASQIKL